MYFQDIVSSGRIRTLGPVRGFIPTRIPMVEIRLREHPWSVRLPRALSMEHQLTIAYGGGAEDQPFEDLIHVMARMNIRSFEDDGYPDLVDGNLLGMPAELCRRVQDSQTVRVDLGGHAYQFASLDANGHFQLRAV